MPYVAKHQPQLGRGVPVPGRSRGSVDCGPRSWQMVADQRTDGRIRPGVKRLRRRGSVPGPQPTSLTDAWRALDGRRVPGREPLRFYRKRTVAQLKQGVRKGRPAVVAISYRAWNASQDETGDPYFTGAHSVAILGERDRRAQGSRIEWLISDPLDDGRRSGIARGPRWVLRRDVINAAVALGGSRNRIYAGIVGGGRRARS